MERKVEAHYTQNNWLGIWEEERLHSFSGSEARISRLIYRRSRKEGGREREGGKESYQKQTNI